MSCLLIFAPEEFPLVCVTKLSAALVLLEVSACNVVVGTIFKLPATSVAGRSSKTVAIASIPLRISSPEQIAACARQAKVAGPRKRQISFFLTVQNRTVDPRWNHTALGRNAHPNAYGVHIQNLAFLFFSFH